MSIAHADGTIEGGSPARRVGASKRAHRNVVETIALNEGRSAATPGSPEVRTATPEIQQASAEAYEEEIMRLSREFNDRWLVVKAYKDQPANSDGAGASLLMKILEGTEAEQREALQSIVPRPQPRRPKVAPPPRVAAAAPEPEPELELAATEPPSPIPNSAAALSAWAGAAAGAARELLSPVVSLAGNQAPAPTISAEEAEPLERSHSAEQQDMAKQYWQYNLRSEDRNDTLNATFCCHCVVAGAPAASECSALVFFAEGDAAEMVIVRESAVVGGDAPEGLADQIGRHPLFELCKVVRGDSDQYLRLEFEGGKAYVLLTRDEATSKLIMEQLDEDVGMGESAAIDGAQQTRATLCETLRAHHTEVDDDEGKDMTEDELLAYFLLFQLDAAGDDSAGATSDPLDVSIGLADKFCASSLSEGRPRTLVMSMDWLYLCREDYAIYPLPPMQVAPPDRPNFHLGTGPQNKQILSDLTNARLLGGPNGTELELIFDDDDAQCEKQTSTHAQLSALFLLSCLLLPWSVGLTITMSFVAAWRLLAATQEARAEIVGELKAAWKSVFMRDLPVETSR